MATIVLSHPQTWDITAACATGLQLGDCVSVTGAMLNGLTEVVRADPSSWELFPAVGVVSAKLTGTICTVTVGGFVHMPSALAPNASYFVGVDGRPTATRPRGTEDAPLFVQRIGQAVSATTMVVRGSGDVVLVRS